MHTHKTGESSTLINNFETYLLQNNRATETIRTRMSQVKLFNRYYPNLLHVTTVDILAYLNPRTRQLSDAYRDSLLDGLRVFYSWLMDNGYIAENPAKSVPSIKYRPEIKPAMPREQVLELFDELDLTEQTIVSLAYLQMMRRSEIAQAHPKDRIGTYLQVQGKGAKPRTLPLAKTTLRNLLALEETQGKEEFYFPGRFEGHIHSATLHKWIKRRVGAEWSLHSFRRSGAVHAYQCGASLRVLQEILGHQSLATTQAYLAVTQDSLREAIDAIDLDYRDDTKQLNHLSDEMSPDEMITAIYSVIAKQQIRI